MGLGDPPEQGERFLPTARPVEPMEGGRFHHHRLLVVRLRTEDSVGLISSLTDEQLDLPMRTRTGTVGDVIERTLIGHFDTHRVEIEAKLDRLLG